MATRKVTPKKAPRGGAKLQRIARSYQKNLRAPAPRRGGRR